MWFYWKRHRVKIECGSSVGALRTKRQYGFFNGMWHPLLPVFVWTRRHISSVATISLLPLISRWCFLTPAIAPLQQFGRKSMVIMICKKFARISKTLNEFTRICKNLNEKIRKNLRESEHIGKSMQESSRIGKKEFAQICKNLSESTRINQNL